MVRQTINYLISLYAKAPEQADVAPNPVTNIEILPNGLAAPAAVKVNGYRTSSALPIEVFALFAAARYPESITMAGVPLKVPAVLNDMAEYVELT